MKQNLKDALDKKHVTNRAVCELLGVSDKTLYNKLNGETDFTISEALLIVRNLLPEYNIEYLFASTK